MILYRIGSFLRDDRNFAQAIELLGKAVAVLEEVRGSRDIDTLHAKGGSRIGV